MSVPGIFVLDICSFFGVLFGKTMAKWRNMSFNWWCIRLLPTI